MKSNSASNKLKEQLFTDMVMQEAIKDKEAQVAEEEKAIYQASVAQEAAQEWKMSLDSDDDFNDFDDDDEAMRQIREKRLREMQSAKEELVTNKAKGYGTYREISQDDFLPYVTKNSRVVCHFYHNDFEKCKIIAMHLREICQTHLETLFLTIDVEKAPFFVEKLAI